MNEFLSAVIAQLIERVFKSKFSTIGGILGAASASLGNFTAFVPPKYQSYVVMGGTLLAAVSAVLAHDSKK